MTINKTDILSLPIDDQIEIATMIVDNISTSEPERDIYDKRFDDMVSGKAKTYTHKEAMELIKSQIKT